MSKSKIGISVVLFAAFAVAFSGCVSTGRTAASDAAPVDMSVSELSPATQAAVYEHVASQTASDEKIRALDQSLENLAILRRFWLAEKKRAEFALKRIPNNYPEGARKADLVKAQRRNLYEVNLQQERIILIDDYLGRLEKEIGDLEAERFRAVMEKAGGV